VFRTMGWNLELGCIKKRCDLQFSIYTSSACSAPFKSHLTTCGGSILWWLWSSVHHACRCIVLLMYKSLWKKCADVVKREWRSSEVLSKLQCLNDVISRRRCSSRATVFTYQPVCSLNMLLVLNDLMREYVHADWAIEIVVIAWRIGSVLPARRGRLLPEKKCACICVISFKEIPSAVFIDHHSSRAR